MSDPAATTDTAPAAGLAAQDGNDPAVVDMPQNDSEGAEPWLFEEEFILLFGILAGSVLTMIAAARNCDVDSTCSDAEGWAVACGTISGVAALFHLGTHKFSPSLHNSISKYMAIFFLIWWT